MHSRQEKWRLPPLSIANLQDIQVGPLSREMLSYHHTLITYPYRCRRSGGKYCRRRRRCRLSGFLTAASVRVCLFAPSRGGGGGGVVRVCHWRRRRRWQRRWQRNGFGVWTPTPHSKRFLKGESGAEQVDWTWTASGIGGGAIGWMDEWRTSTATDHTRVQKGFFLPPRASLKIATLLGNSRWRGEEGVGRATSGRGRRLL